MEGADINMPFTEGEFDHLQHIQSYLSNLMTANHEGSYLTFNFQKLQKRFSEALYSRVTRNFERLSAGDPTEATTRTNQYYSGKWLLLPPTPSTYFANPAFRTAIALKLNLSLLNPGVKCVHCKQPVDVKGHHFLSCSHACLKNCHDLTRNVVAQFLERLGYKVYIGEIPINALSDTSPLHNNSTLRSQGSHRRNSTPYPSNNNTSTQGTRVDILATRPGTNERPIYMDVQVVNSVAPSFISLEHKENLKEGLHRALVEEQEGQYWAPTFDCFGNPSKKTEKTMKDLYELYLASLSQSERAQMISEGRQINYWFSRISFCINHMKAEMTHFLLGAIKEKLHFKPNPKDLNEQRVVQSLMRSEAGRC